MDGVGKQLGKPRVQCVDIARGVVGLQLHQPVLISEGRSESSRRGPNATTILAICASAIRTVEDLRVRYPSSHLLHHSSTVILAASGAIHEPVCCLVIS